MAGHLVTKHESNQIFMTLTSSLGAVNKWKIKPVRKKMKDIALTSEGTRVYFASCRDDKYPLKNIIDGKWDTFWPTSGLFPHSFIITFRSLMKISSMSIQSYNVKLMRIDKSSQDLPISFEKYIDQQALGHEDRRVNTWNIRDSCVAHHLRFVILDGYDHFTAVHNLQILAEPTKAEPFKPETTFTHRDPIPVASQEETEPVWQPSNNDFGERRLSLVEPKPPGLALSNILSRSTEVDDEDDDAVNAVEILSS